MMKKTIIIETNGHKDNYVEWDLVLMRPASVETYEERLAQRASENNWYRYDYPQKDMVEEWNEQYWDKYILGRIQDILLTYSWKIFAKVDFVYLSPEWFRGTYTPFGWRYKYFDASRVDIIKCISYNRDTYINDIREFLSKPEWCGVPKNKIVYCKWANLRWADLKNRDADNLINRIEWRRIDRAIRNTIATPEEVMARNVYPN